jgi:outer membrane protein
MRSLFALCSLLLVSSALAQDGSPRVLTLDAALSTARSNNPNLRSAVALSDAADARQDKARAGLLPSVVGTASYARTTSNFVPRPGLNPNITVIPDLPPYSSKLYNTFAFGATASIVVFDFGVINRFRSSKEARRGFEERTRAALLTADYAVRNAFFSARAQKSLIGVARETLANNQRHLEQTQAFVEVGTRPEIDLLQVRTDLANSRVTLLQNENSYAVARINLQLAMGVEGALDFEVADEQLAPVSSEDSSLDELLREAFEARPDMKALQRDLRVNQLNEGALAGGYAPSVTASSAITRGGIDLDKLGTNWNVGLAANWPLFSGLGTRADMQEARANQRNNEAQIALLRQNVRLQVEQSRLGVLAALAVLEASGEALANAEGRLKLAEGRYEAGVGNAIELGDAQVALTQAESQSVSAEFSLSLARAQLLNALGRSQ